jgi:mono/diheme cytochrome c family protein
MRRFGNRWMVGSLFLLIALSGSVAGGRSADSKTPPQQGRAKPDQSVKNPLPATLENVQKGKEIYYGKGFCVTCHGRDGKGMGHVPGLRGALPRDFTNQTWQKLRTDEDLIRVLRNGSAGTAMAPFVPLVLSEEEAWQVILFVRTFGQ